MFHSTIKTKKFDNVVKTLKKEPAPDLSNYQAFCSIDNTDDKFMTDSEIIIDYQTVEAKTTYVDFQRPFIEKSENSMDIEGGKTYKAYMSFYLNKDTGTKTSSVTGDKKGKAPVFIDMPISNIKMPEEAVEQNNYSVRTGSLRGLATVSAMIVLLANMQ